MYVLNESLKNTMFINQSAFKGKVYKIENIFVSQKDGHLNFIDFEIVVPHVVDCVKLDIVLEILG